MYQLRVTKLAVRFYHQTKEANLPNHLKKQFERSSSSISMNLSEGTGRKTTKDRNHFFTIAMGSIRECQNVVELESRSFTEKDIDLLDHIAASTYKLIHNSRKS